MNLLEKAEAADRFREMCKRSAVNSSARALCSYTVWNDQSLALKTKALIEDPSIEVVILHPSAEGGMPHTRAGSLICLPAHFPESRIDSTLKHEMVHIWQRKQPSLWTTRLKMDGWEVADEDDIPNEWLHRCRLNPDTIANRWFAWKGRYIPLPLFVREDKPDLHDIVVRWYDLDELRVISNVPSSLTQKYGNLGTSSLEHPYELYAYR